MAADCAAMRDVIGARPCCERAACDALVVRDKGGAQRLRGTGSMIGAPVLWTIARIFIASDVGNIASI